MLTHVNKSTKVCLVFNLCTGWLSSVHSEFPSSEILLSVLTAIVRSFRKCSTFTLCNYDELRDLICETLTRDAWRTYPNHVLPRFISHTIANCIDSETSYILTVANVITARKRSLGQSNVFIRVCHSVHEVGLPTGRFARLAR